MCTTSHEIEMGFTGEHFEMGTHICLIYSSEEERKYIISRFLERGLAGNERVAYFADNVDKTVVRDWLEELGVDISQGDVKRSFVLANTNQVYHPSGTFVPEEMLNTLKNFYLRSIEEEYSGARGTAEMEWAVKGIPGSERLMEYESKINLIVKDYPITALCQYDVNKFDGATILECLKVHPYMIVKGQVVNNPYYIRPEEYLREKLIN